jgi:hypothetical protein
MKKITKKLSFILVLVLLVNLLLPSLSFAAEADKFIEAQQIQSDIQLESEKNNSDITTIEQVYGPNSSQGEVKPTAVPAFFVLATALISRIATIIRVSATAATTTVYRAFTYSNFRYNLIIRTGGNPGTTYQAHHIFPDKFASRWQSIGLQHNNPNYGTWLESSYHGSINAQYNQQWTNFFTFWDIKGITPTMTEVMSHARGLVSQYNFATYF